MFRLCHNRDDGQFHGDGCFRGDFHSELGEERHQSDLRLHQAEPHAWNSSQLSD